MRIDRIGFANVNRRPAQADLRRLRTQAARVTTQEYLPFAAWLLSWAALTAGLGLDAAMLLMAANGFVQAIRSLFLLQSSDAISARSDCAPDLKRLARCVALKADVVSLVGCLALLLPCAFYFSVIGLDDLASMMLVMTIGLPARTPGLICFARPGSSSAWRIGAAAAMVVGAGLVFVLGLSWIWGAVALALREWGGLFATGLIPRARRSVAPGSMAALDFAEIAARTRQAARRRLVYRIGKVVLSLLGPAGSILARTGRGAGLDGRLAQRLDVKPAPVLLLASAGSVAVVASIAVSHDPAVLLIASVAARIAAVSLSVLLWWRWGAGAAKFEWLNDE